MKTRSVTILVQLGIAEKMLKDISRALPASEFNRANLSWKVVQMLDFVKGLEDELLVLLKLSEEKNVCF